MKKTLLIILLCVAGLVVAFLAMAGLSAWLDHKATAPLSKPPEHGTEFLVEADFSQTPGDTNSLASLKEVLNARFSGMGERVFIESLPPSQLQVELPTISNEEADSISNAIARRGFLERRMVHEDSDEIIKNNWPIQPGYEVVQAPWVRRGEQTAERLVVKKQAEAGLTGSLVQSSLVAHDKFGTPQIEFTLNKDAAARFAQLTTKYAPNPKTNVRHRIAIIIDGALYSAPVVATPITGGVCMIAGNFTDEQAQQLAQMLNNPLPVPVKIISKDTY